MNLSPPALAMTALMISTSGALAAEADVDRTWLTDQSGCKVLEPRKARTYSWKAIWDGVCVDGLISGQGTLKVGPVTFTGEFKEGQIVSGEATEQNASFVGQFQDNMMSKGVYKFGDLSITGVFDREGQTVGSAVMEWSNGSRYEGGLGKSYALHGKGRYTSAGGEYYEGEHLNGLRHGTGTWVTPSGWTYTGQYAFGKRDGQGTEVFQDGSRYVGEYKAGERHGQGRFTDANGGIFEGEWRIDKLNGKCKTQEATGDKFEGTCLAGKPSGQGRFERAADETVYEGEFKDGRSHGQGRLKAPGYAYEGAFALGMKNGRGKEVLETGEQYEGEFVRNERTGQGVLRVADEDGTSLTYDGTFNKGVFAGQGTLTVGDASFKGEFKQGVFIRGVMHTTQGKTIELDSEKQTYMEVLKDGTKVPVDPSAIALPPEV